ncbi:BREX-1 system phosphatase PglZ type A [Asticcacaulis sp. AC402]|uniref:BREX-1 system phosphatase PglZ type A n=1 Tax=Asticcacaulis sp. AC402 TaxID=1282361 RepID=UPI0003C3C12C|nr:BREX-1 system phosphatase PglZ type A [Asticcacaulis sp. AC402]ESQ75035.1 hypothetical protein ABAC402_11565 [Asticcacaulis sp. AC402]
MSDPTTERIMRSLKAQFDQHRVVFWYDAESEFAHLLPDLALSDVMVIEMANNEFGVKHRILREAPKDKFLIYSRRPRPEGAKNWLLDVELSHTVFKTDQIAAWLAELNLPVSFEDVVREHQEFFRSGKRLEKLKASLDAKDTRTVLRLRMLAICANTDARLDAVVEVLLSDLAQEREDTLKLISRVGLADFLWSQIDRHYGYKVETPTVRDFAITLFKSCFAVALNVAGSLNTEAVVLFKRWRNSRTAVSAFRTLSASYAEVLHVEGTAAQKDFRTLLEIDYFEVLDRVIIRALVDGLSQQVLKPSDVLNWVRQRRQSYWYADYRDLYEAIYHGAEFQQNLAAADLTMSSLSDGILRYQKTWYRIDQLYRKFVYHAQESKQAGLLKALSDQIENHYSNAYLLRLNDTWQGLVDAAPQWEAAGVLSHRAFFRTVVGEFRRKDQRICVIISDAMRYEVGEEFLTRIRSVDKYDASIEPMLGCLPSYTQLGMASLLPNETIEIADNDSGTVIVDGLPSQGLENRKRLLANGRTGDAATAIKYEAFMGLGKDEARALVKDHDVLYIYHNLIDNVGDKAATEERVFNAAEKTIEELVTVVKKLNAANAANIVVTADHGFLYQNRPIEESDYSTAVVEGDTVLYRDRRFILGHGLKADHGLRHFAPAQVKLQGTVEVLIPKSINRLRRTGSGSRFVHGGASLQEIVVPVVRVNKKRQSDTGLVDVEIIGSSNNLITSSQFAVRYYQTAPVTEKIQPRTLVLGLFSQSGDLISDSHVLVFDSRSDNPRDREQSVRFLLSRQADNYNNQEVVLKVQEQVGETSHYTDYKTSRFTLRRTFSNDFDF